MRYLGLLAILIVTTGQAMSQQRPKYETVPDHSVLLAIAFQRNSPLRIESATFLKRVDQPGVLIKYRVRNVSNKPISFISVMIQSASGSNENFMPLGRSGRLLPNETLDSTTAGTDYEVVGVYKPAQKPDSTREEMKALYILFVEKVEFADRTTYENSMTQETLSRFFLDFCSR